MERLRTPAAQQTSLRPLADQPTPQDAGASPLPLRSSQHDFPRSLPPFSKLGDKLPEFGRGRSWGLLARNGAGRPATFGYQPTTSGWLSLFNFAQIRLRKRVTIFGIHDQKRSYQIRGREL